MNSDGFTSIQPDIAQVLEAVRMITEEIKGTSASETLQHLVEAAANALHADIVFIGKIEEELASIYTIAQVVDGKRSEPFQYNLRGTPMEKGIETGICFYGDNVAGRFPEDSFLKEMNVKGYVGTALHKSRGDVSGVMAALFHDTPDKITVIRDIFNIFAIRASAELEREELEHQLSLSEKHHRRFFNEDLTGNYVTTPEGRLLDANPKFLRLYGFKSLKQAQETDMSRLYPRKADREHLLQLLKEKRKIEDLEDNAVRLDGTPFMIRENVVGEFDHQGELVKIRGYIIDITERKKIVDALRDSRERLALHVEQTPLAIIEWDLNFKVQGWNPAAEKIFGYSRDEAIGQHVSFIVPKTARMHVEKIWKSTISQKNGSRSINDNMTKEGTVISCEWYNTPLVDENDSTIGVASMVMDVSEKIRQEKELKRNQLRLITAQQAAGLGFVEWDVVRNRVFLSKESIDIMGMDGREGWRDVDLVAAVVHPDHRETVRRRLIQAIKDDFPYKLDYKVIRPVDGKTIWIRGTGTVDRDKEGKAVRMIGSAQDITKEKEAKIKLQNSEEKFRVLTESSPVAIMIYQKERWIYANPAAADITGYSTEELYRLKWWDIVHPDHREVVKKRGMARLDRKVALTRYEFKITRKDGEERWVDSTGNLIEFAGVPSGLIVAIDITEKKTVEMQLRNNEARLKVLFDQSPVSLWEEDFSEIKTRMDALREAGVKDMRVYLNSHPDVLQELVNSVKVTDVNQATLDMFHAQDKKSLVRNFEKVLHSEAMQVWTEELCSFYEGKLEFSREGIARTLNGEEIYGHWRFSLPEEYRESWEKVLLSITDITERYGMETQLRESESNFRALFEQSPVALKLEDFSAVKTEIDKLQQAEANELRERLSTDLELLRELAGKVRTISMNEAARNLFRIPAEKSESMALTQILTEHSLKNFGIQITALLDGGTRYAREGETKIFDGELKYVFVQLSLVEEVEGTWDRVLVSIVDLTEKKLLEKEQKKLEAQLRQSQKLETVGTLAGGIAHDFNNILTPILGYTELARMKVPEDSPVADYLDRIETASTRAKALVKQMLTFSRRSDDEKVPTRLAPVVEEVVQLVRSSIPATITIETTIDQNCGMVVADETQIHQVILNLCTNAAQAMPFGGTLTISLKQTEIGEKVEAELSNLKPGPHLMLTVRDTGTGMDEETRQRVFDPFFTTKEVGKGTGLGLSMVHGVAESHGGCCTVDSRLGEGSTFRVYLPVIDSADTPQTPEKFSRAHEVTKKGTGRVLIVDDDPDVLDLHREVLSGIGCQVRTFSSSEDALAEIQENPQSYDAIVTDLTMPGVTGLQLAVGLYEIRSDLPVVLVTGYREELTPEIRSRTGIRKVLMKPVKIQTLCDAVKEVLKDTFSG